MSETFDVNAQPRADTGTGASRRLRRQGLVPAILYGGAAPPENIALVHHELLKHLEHEAFYSTLLNLRLDGQVQQVVLKDLQRHPARPLILHVDFQRVSQDEVLRMNVPIHFENAETCRGVKLGGKISHHLNEIEVVCLPRDLPEFIAVDMAELDIGAVVHVAELRLPPRVKLATSINPDMPVVTVHAGYADSDASAAASDT